MDSADYRPFRVFKPHPALDWRIDCNGKHFAWSPTLAGALEEIHAAIRMHEEGVLALPVRREAEGRLAEQVRMATKEAIESFLRDSRFKAARL